MIKMLMMVIWKAITQSVTLERALLLFSAPANYGVVKIMHSSSEVVLRTIEHTMIYPGLGLSLEVITLYPVV
jgi:hypothetical protein